jgi:hypothetical protein
MLQSEKHAQELPRKRFLKDPHHHGKGALICVEKVLGKKPDPFFFSTAGNLSMCNAHITTMPHSHRLHLLVNLLELSCGNAHITTIPTTLRHARKVVVLILILQHGSTHVTGRVSTEDRRIPWSVCFPCLFSFRSRFLSHDVQGSTRHRPQGVGGYGESG